MINRIVRILRRRQDRPLVEGQYLERMRELWKAETMTAAQKDALAMLARFKYMTPTDAQIYIGPQWRRTIAVLQNLEYAEFHNARIRITEQGKTALQEVAK